jgi:hypothetical protein
MIGLVAPIGWLGYGGSIGAAPPPPLPPTPAAAPVVGGPATLDAWGSWQWPEDVYPTDYVLLTQSHTDRWTYEMSFHFERRKSQRLEALLARLKGPHGRVALWDLDRETPLGATGDWSSLPRTRFTDLTQFTDGTMFGPGRAGYRVYGNWPMGAEEIVIFGFRQYTTELVGADQIGLNGRLYRLNRDATGDGLGKARVYLHRGLLAAVTHGTTVVTTRPTSPFAVVDDDQGARSRSTHGLPTISLRFVEAL